MAVYVIGDVHGCYDELCHLLDKVKFNPFYDKIIFVGDLVGRGPHSLEVAELVTSLGSAVINVLGNHDIKFIATAYNVIPFNKTDCTEIILNSPKLSTYVSWLIQSKLMHVDEESQVAIIHAGIPPTWSINSEAEKYSTFFTEYLKTKGNKETLKTIYKKSILRWHSSMTEEEIIQYSVFGFTRMKYCFKDGSFDSEYQGAPGTQPTHLNPWFLVREKNLNEKNNLIFGHWAALGLYHDFGVTCCDTGCVWGGKLTAIQIAPTWRVYQIESNYSAHKISLRISYDKYIKFSA